jgi:hypothetical protein
MVLYTHVYLMFSPIERVSFGYGRIRAFEF